MWRNFNRFLARPDSILTETSLQSNLSMVRVWACPNSQHSKWKIIDHIDSSFPGLSNYISVFYGNYFDAPLDSRTNLTKFDRLSLLEFYQLTKPEMVVLRVSKVNTSIKRVQFFGWLFFFAGPLSLFDWTNPLFFCSRTNWIFKSTFKSKKKYQILYKINSESLICGIDCISS